MRYSPEPSGSDNPPVQAISRKGRVIVLAVSEIPDAIGFYFAGFVDGEGSFNLSFRKRKDYNQPWKVSLCLNVSQKDESILALLQETLQCGTIRYKCDGVWFFEVNSLVSIRDHVIPFFDHFSFLSNKKKRDFAIFRRMAMLMLRGDHLREEGIVELLRMRRDMNDGGKRKYSEEQILSVFDDTESSETIRQTPGGSSGDEIVRSAWRHAERGGNDLVHLEGTNLSGG